MESNMIHSVAERYRLMAESYRHMANACDTLASQHMNLLRMHSSNLGHVNDLRNTFSVSSPDNASSTSPPSAPLSTTSFTPSAPSVSSAQSIPVRTGFSGGGPATSDSSIFGSTTSRSTSFVPSLFVTSPNHPRHSSSFSSVPFSSRFSLSSLRIPPPPVRNPYTLSHLRVPLEPPIDMSNDDNIEEKKSELEELDHDDESENRALDLNDAGMPDFMIASLPTWNLSSVANLDENLRSCRICLHDFENNVVIKTLSCFHFFHKHCIDQWLHHHSRCPVCRADAYPDLPESPRSSLLEDDNEDNDNENDDNNPLSIV